MSMAVSVVATVLATCAGAASRLPKEQRKPTSVEARESKSAFVAIRFPTLVVVDGFLGGDAGAEAGVFLSPSLQAWGAAQTGFIGKSFSRSSFGKISQAGIGLRQFFGNAFFASAGLQHRSISIEFRDDEQLGDIDNRYGSATAASLGAAASVGWLWQMRTVGLGLELLTVHQPLAVLHENSDFAETYTGNKRTADDVTADGRSLARAADFHLTRFILGWSF